MGPYSLICVAPNYNTIAKGCYSKFDTQTFLQSPWGVSPVPAPHCTIEDFTPLVLFISTEEFLKHLM